MKRHPLAHAVRLLLSAGFMVAAIAAQAESTTEHQASTPGTQVYTRADIERAGYTDLAEFLQDLPQHGTGKTLKFGGLSLEGDTAVDFRRAGVGGTVLLVDGERWLAGVNGTFDLSALPLAAIERVELHQDGSGSRDGSHALGATIDVITRRHFDGADAGGTFGRFDEGDGERGTADFAIGAVGDRAAASVVVSHVDYDGLLSGDRDISAVPVAGLPANLLSGGGSTTTPYGRFGFGPAGTRLPNSTTPGNLTLIPGRAGAATGDFRVFNPEGDSYNFQPFVSLQMPSERSQALASASYALTDAITVRASTFYSERLSEQQLGAPLLLVGVAGAGVARFPIPVNQAYNPFGAPVTRAQFRLLGLDRDFRQDVDTFRSTLGAEGGFDWADRRVDWRLGAIYADIESHQLGTGVIDLNAVANALGPSFRDAAGVWRCGTNNVAIAGCVPLNIFGGPTGLTPEMLDYLSATSQQTSAIDQWQYYAGARTSLFELPAGALNLDLSYHFRREEGFDQPDAFIATGNSTGTGLSGARAKFAVDEYRVALDVPLFADAPLARSLDLSFTGDYSRYDNGSSAFSPGVALNWRPAEEWTLRLVTDHGLREPSVRELGLDSIETFSGFIDPCAASVAPSAEVLARCRGGFGGVTPVPVGYDFNGGEGATEFSGGNAGLAPERSRSHQLTLAYEPRWLTGLTLDLTWYERDARHLIGFVNGGELLDRCYTRGQAAWCAAITRDATGDVRTLQGGLYNTDQDVHVEGYELHAAHTHDGAFGKLTFDFLAHYLAQWERDDAFSGPAYFNAIGERNGGDGAINRLRANFSATWERGDFGVTLGARYYSAVDGACLAGLSTSGENFAAACDNPDRVVDDGGFSVRSPEDRAGSTWFSDAQLRWDAPWNAQLSLTVRNLFDENPPTAFDGSEGNYDPQYATPGRFWFVGYRQRF